MCDNIFAHLDASLAASQFYHLVGAIGVRISSLPGAVRQLGKSMKNLETSWNAIIKILQLYMFLRS